MRVIIIEDEQLTAKKLVGLLNELMPDAIVMGVLQSVSESIEWFNNNLMPDLVFMDIHLADNLSFSIFDSVKITCPIIFTTAYDEHAIQAFKVNSVDYLLKPVEEDDLLAALRKFEQFRVVQSPVTDYRKLEEALMSNCKKNRFLIQKGDAYHYVETSDIAFFYSEEKVVFLHTFSDKRYIVDYTLEQIEQLLDERTFFRVSRNCIANINSIRKISKYFNSRLKLSFQPECPHEVLISRVRVPDFLKWVDGVL